MKEKLLKCLPILFLICAAFIFTRDNSPVMTWLYVQQEHPLLEGVSIQTDREVYSKWHSTVNYQILNFSQEYIQGGHPDFRDDFRVEQWTETGWRYWTIDLEHPDNAGYMNAAVGYELSSGETGMEFSVSLKKALPELAPGRYRLAWDFDTGSLQEGWTHYTVYREFTIE